MDAVTLDGTLDELRPRLLGQYLGRIRSTSPHALIVELPRGARLWLEAAREIAGPYLLDRDSARALADQGAPVPWRAQQALLLARKHLEGARVAGLDRVPGTRTVRLEAGRAALCLRLGGAAPALTLALDGAALGTVGEGPPAWPPPDPDPDREWDRIDVRRFAADVEEALARGWSDVRAHVSACPPLGPALARLLAAGLLSFEELRERLRRPRPTLVAPRPLDACDDAELAGRGAVRLLPFAPPDADGTPVHPATWASAGAAYLAARLRGQHFARERQRRLEDAGRRVQRLAQLQARLREDLAGLPATDALRRDAEALLAHAGAAPPGAEHVEVPDPWDAARPRRVAIDGRQSLPANADRLFGKARRIDRARRHLDQRLEAAAADLAQARAGEDAARSARNAADLRGPRPLPPGAAAGAARGAGPRRYLTSRGLELVAGRGARENQKVTFEVAGPDDWWLHARDVPGAHVVLRDPAGRASDEDLREAAEVAAFFSTAGAEARADVHLTRRKHVRPAGGPGRVRVLHSQTLRVQPRDPEGRLRKR